MQEPRDSRALTASQDLKDLRATEEPRVSWDHQDLRENLGSLEYRGPTDYQEEREVADPRVEQVYQDLEDLSDQQVVVVSPGPPDLLEPGESLVSQDLQDPWVYQGSPA